MPTPRMVGTAVEAARITEEMRRATPEIEESIRRAPRGPAAPPAVPAPSAAPLAPPADPARTANSVGIVL